MAKISWGNPYTHEEHMRESYKNIDRLKGCAWCGNKPKTLYTYDNNKTLFCNKNCRHDYHV